MNKKFTNLKSIAGIYGIDYRTLKKILKNKGINIKKRSGLISPQAYNNIINVLENPKNTDI